MSGVDVWLVPAAAADSIHVTVDVDHSGLCGMEIYCTCVDMGGISALSFRSDERPHLSLRGIRSIARALKEEPWSFLSGPLKHHNIFKISESKYVSCMGLLCLGIGLLALLAPFVGRLFCSGRHCPAFPVISATKQYVPRATGSRQPYWHVHVQLHAYQAC